MKCIDLFSGLGGFSEAFARNGCDVLRIDNNDRFQCIPHTIITDVYTLTSENLKDADIILASPPCTHFSFAAVTKQGSKHWPKGIPTKETLEQIKLVKYTIKIIKGAKPKYWILENPRGRLRKILGAPAMTTYWAAWGTPYLKPTHLWGKLPPIDWKQPMKWESNPSGGVGSGVDRPYPRDLAKRALIPYEFSKAVYDAVVGNSAQETLE